MQQQLQQQQQLHPPPVSIELARHDPVEAQAEKEAVKVAQAETAGLAGEGGNSGSEGADASRGDALLQQQQQQQQLLTPTVDEKWTNAMRARVLAFGEVRRRQVSLASRSSCGSRRSRRRRSACLSNVSSSGVATRVGAWQRKQQQQHI
jgi:hypothetical protein